jgi:Fis family transcriptional regulator
VQQQRPALQRHVEEVVDGYLREHDQQANDLYDHLLAQVEEPLLAALMRQLGDNQSEAARVLGLSRGTLRKKLKRYALL